MNTADIPVRRGRAVAEGVPLELVVWARIREWAKINAGLLEWPVDEWALFDEVMLLYDIMASDESTDDEHLAREAALICDTIEAEGWV